MRRLTKRFEKYQIAVEPGKAWSARELDGLYKAISLFSDYMGGEKIFEQRIGKLTIERSDTGRHLGLAYHDLIKLSVKERVSTWSVFHELAHVWDAKSGWGLSRAMEKYTGGRTSRFFSFLRRFTPGGWDAGWKGPENKPGRYGRKPGCNSFGYLYGDKPSGSNWNFNRREDFAESVVMYFGWADRNELSKTAHGRIERYLLPNGRKDPIYKIADNWTDYARYFYPPLGDYTKSKRWRFIHELVHEPDEKEPPK